LLEETRDRTWNSQMRWRYCYSSLRLIIIQCQKWWYDDDENDDDDERDHEEWNHIITKTNHHQALLCTEARSRSLRA
jgi:hypothetical protein